MAQALQARIAAFPKCYMDELCKTRSLSLFEWIEMAATLGVKGLEFYPGFFVSFEQSYLDEIRRVLQRHNLLMPMVCASPDFTRPSAKERRAEIERCKRMIDLVAFFEAPAPRTCRVLSGQRRPELTEDDGVAMVVECIEQVLPYAAERGVILAMENHYKDNYWTYPEFAQHLFVFKRIVDAIDSPWFGVNYDPSNALLAGEDPLVVLDAIKERVVSMHASDRSLAPGSTIEDLRRQENSVGYAAILRHGEIGTGLNDYPTIFRILQSVGFRGWISIEDGMNGLDEIRRSADFLRATLAAVSSSQ
ncbi:myo-inositol catabolism protein IolH [Reticulibacter mediterranei]|uniref:Myo-inositol catabolism protein IolH n=1 Tax=Reticulibacter mediterranei TaxID=2778369 RepID=A0A8J3NB24_9CHLR|nr:sugar phosphate isomerase/epimerase family protein [Reticulibacter mediterranei]GHP01028.1 myo-inositol catabolism protein IolH [Reticulibacter mediterranei]